MDTTGFVFYEPQRARPRIKPTMTITPLNGAGFNSQVAEALGHPKYVTVLYHRAKKIFILRSCDESCIGAYEVAERKGRFNITQRSLSDIIYMLTNWNRDLKYKVVGKYDPEAAGVVFNLNVAEYVEKRSK